MQVAVENYLVSFLESRLNRSRLVNDIQTVAIPLKHFVNFLKMSLGDAYPFQRLYLKIIRFHAPIPYPVGGGDVKR